MNSAHLYISAIILIFICSCTKKEYPNPEPIDSIVIRNIRGMVFNNCTDSGLADIPLFLNVYSDNDLVKKYSAISGDSGKFFFDHVEMHTSPLYSYDIFIPSKSGFVVPRRSETGFDGTRMTFSTAESYLFLRPQVTPRIYYLNFHFEREKESNIDSLHFTASQEIFHNNVPDLPHILKARIFKNSNNGSGNWGGGYPSGKYKIEITKWKGKDFIIEKDEMYIKFQDSLTHVIEW
jgi:hypothetical protein